MYLLLCSFAFLYREDRYIHIITTLFMRRPLYFVIRIKFVFKAVNAAPRFSF